MPLDWILTKVASDYGASNLDGNPDVKALLIDVINEAAEEVYEQKDLPGCLREVFIRTQSDTELALPYFVGELRAMREAETQIPWSFIDLRPRYHEYNWKHEWKSWRLKGTSALQLGITVATPPILKIPVSNNDLTVTVVGSTVNAARVIEATVMDNTTIELDNAFTEINSITKNILGNHNVSVEDSEENVLSEITNDVLEARYVIVDVSRYPWSGTSGDCFIMEVLYKLKLKRLENLDDVFPVEGFDKVIAIKALQILTEGQEGKEDRALLMDAKATRLINQKLEHKEGTTNKLIQFKPNKLLGLFSRRRYRRMP